VTVAGSGAGTVMGDDNGNAIANQEQDERGRFLPGNTLGARRGSEQKRVLLTETLLSTVTQDSMAGMVQNLVSIALNPKTPNAAIRAFSVLADCLGLKESTLQILGSDGERPNPLELRARLWARVAELTGESLVAGESEAGFSVSR